MEPWAKESPVHLLNMWLDFELIEDRALKIRDCERPTFRALLTY
jgi:hypothetical protein